MNICEKSKIPDQKLGLCVWYINLHKWSSFCKNQSNKLTWKWWEQCRFLIINYEWLFIIQKRTVCILNFQFLFESIYSNSNYLCNLCWSVYIGLPIFINTRSLVAILKVRQKMYKQICSFVFWKNLRILKSPFKVNWTLSHGKLPSYKFICLNFSPNLQARFSIKTEPDLSIAPLIGAFMRPLTGDNLLCRISEPSSIDKKFSFNQLIPCNLYFSLCEMSEDNQDSQCMKLHTFIGVLNFYYGL